MPSIRTFERVQGSGPPKRKYITEYAECSMEYAVSGFRGGDPSSSAVQQRDVDVGHWPPWLAEPLVGRDAVPTTGHREMGIGHRPRGAPILRNLVWEDSMRTFGRYEGRERWRGSTLPIGYARARESLGNGPPWSAEPFVGRDAVSTTGLHPPPRGSCELGRGGPPWLAVQHREVDVGRGRCGPNAPVGRTSRLPEEASKGGQASSTTELAAP